MNNAEDMMQKNRIAEIDLLRGIASILVVIGHSITKIPIDIQGTVWGGYLREFIGSYHMPLFFIISGYVFKYKHDYKRYIFKKANRLIVPLLIWGTIDVCLHTSAIVNDVTVSGSLSFIDGIVGMLFRGEELWFFYVLFCIFIVYPVIADLKPLYKIVIALISAMVNLSFDLPSIFCIKKVVYYLFFFIIGNVIRVDWEKARRNSKKLWYWGAAIILLAFYSFSVAYYRNDHSQPAVYGLYLKPLIMSIVTVQIVISTAGMIYIIDHFLTYCSFYSAQLYIFQFYTITIGRIILYRYLHITSPMVTFIALSLCSIVFILLLCRFVISKNKYIRIVCGA